MIHWRKTLQHINVHLDQLKTQRDFDYIHYSGLHIYRKELLADNVLNLVSL